jgi:hypothetical protein
MALAGVLHFRHHRGDSSCTAPPISFRELCILRAQLGPSFSFCSPLLRAWIPHQCSRCVLVWMSLYRDMLGTLHWIILGGKPSTCVYIRLPGCDGTGWLLCVDLSQSQGLELLVFLCVLSSTDGKFETSIVDRQVRKHINAREVSFDLRVRSFPEATSLGCVKVCRTSSMCSCGFDGSRQLDPTGKRLHTTRSSSERIREEVEKRRNDADRV